MKKVRVLSCGMAFVGLVLVGFWLKEEHNVMTKTTTMSHPKSTTNSDMKKNHITVSTQPSYLWNSSNTNLALDDSHKNTSSTIGSTILSENDDFENDASTMTGPALPPTKSSIDKLTVPTSSVTSSNVSPIMSTIIIIVKLSGGMGNNLSKLARGRALQLWLMSKQQAENEDDKKTTGRRSSAVVLLLRHQNRSKWVQAKVRLQQCFPWTRNFNFSAGNTPQIDHLLEVAAQTTTSHETKTNGSAANNTGSIRLYGIQPQQGINGDNETAVQHAIDGFLTQHDRQLQQNHSISSSTTTSFMYAQSFVSYDFWMDRYYDDFRQTFQYDYANAKCCNPLERGPDPDETVFHFRNFLGELPRQGKPKGFEELNPKLVAHQLLGHLKAGSKVAIVTFTNKRKSVVSDYVQALQSRGLVVRVVTQRRVSGHNNDDDDDARTADMHDFCFLLQTQKELVGMARSTFMYWAAMLGQAQRVRLYSIDSASTRANIATDVVFRHYNWTHAELKRRIHFALYQQ